MSRLPASRTERRTLRSVLALLTILVIVGTLCGCGRYGRPRRPAPEPEARGLVAEVPGTGPALPSSSGPR